MKSKIFSGITLVILCISSFLTFAQSSENKDIPQLGQASVVEILKAMTLEEKASLVVGAGMPGEQSAGENGIVGSVAGKVQGAAGSSAEFKKYGIPGMIMADGPAGVRTCRAQKHHIV